MTRQTPKNVPQPTTGFRKAVIGGSHEEYETMTTETVPRRDFLKMFGTFVFVGMLISGAAHGAEGNLSEPGARPNFVIILTDDQGYQDLGCYGHPQIKTPRIDRMAQEGLRLTSFYAQPLCGPSRAALLTGCYPMRAGFPRMRTAQQEKQHLVSFWQLNPEELTIAEILKPTGYTTACVGKWDLSGRAPNKGQLPNDQGFDYYYGTIGANDGGKVGLMDNRKGERTTDDMGELTGLYTEKAIAFIRENRSKPFFLYLAHTMPHTTIGASAEFKGKSAAGLYGDTIEEIDYNVGRILDTIRELGLENTTYVVFMSDNGPWLSQGKNGGSALPLRNGKASFWDGGFRVPAIIWGPGRIPAGKQSDQIMATIDILPTFASLAGAPLPSGRVIDGKDQSDFILGKTERSARKDFLYYVRESLFAVREGDWKLVLPNKEGYVYATDRFTGNEIQLFNLKNDVSETTNVAEAHPEIVARLMALAKSAQDEIGDNEKPGHGARPFGP